MSQIWALINCASKDIPPTTIKNNYKFYSGVIFNKASIAQLGERKTEDLEAPCSIHGRSIYFFDSF